MSTDIADIRLSVRRYRGPGDHDECVKDLKKLLSLHDELVRALALVQDQLNNVYDGAEDSSNRWMGEIVCEVSRVMGLVRKGEGHGI